ncbi:HipA family kinase [Agarivorans sp. MS3-6]
MSDIVKILSFDKYIAALEHTSDGMMAATHLANVKWLDNKAGRFYVKTYPTCHPRGLINEIVGYLIAHAAGIPQPNKVALIQIPKDVVKHNFKGEFSFTGDYCWGWASEDSGPTPNTYLKVGDMTGYKQCLESLKNWDALPILLAFDDWVANQDRNTGNITIKSRNDFRIIDHGNVPVSEAWTKDCLVVDRVYENKLLDGLYDHNYPLPMSSKLIESTKAHSKIYEQVRLEIKKWSDILLDSSDSEHLRHFLEARARLSVARMKDKTGLLVA